MEGSSSCLIINIINFSILDDSHLMQDRFCVSGATKGDSDGTLYHWRCGSVMSGLNKPRVQMLRRVYEARHLGLQLLYA